MATPAGLAHVAAVSFLAARAAPSLAFWIALAGGAALAREAEARGVRAGYASSAAAMLQTVAIIGPLRFNAPLTQALSAPLLGAMHARGRGAVTLFAACVAIRLAHYTVVTGFALFVLLGPEGYAGSYEALFGWLPFLPGGLGGALLLTAVNHVAFAGFFSAIQVGLYRHALAGWPARAIEDAPVRPAPPPAPPECAGADPRAVLSAAAAVTLLLLVSHDWVVLAAVGAWLAAAAALARRGDRDVLRIGLVLTLALAAGTFFASLVGGLGGDEAASRSVRAALLVLVATWLRVAAGSAGLREAFRAVLLRLRRLPGTREAAEILGELDSGRLLVGSAKALRDRLRGVRRRPVPVTDAVLTWAAQEARSLPVHEPAPVAELRFRARDAVLAASALLPAGALAIVLGG
jgi:hypothetical protein